MGEHAERRNSGTHEVLHQVFYERQKQDIRWGEQNHPDGTGKEYDRGVPDLVRDHVERAFAAGTGTWRDILCEEVAEAYAESDPARLREELVQVAAVAVAWIEAIDRRAEPEGDAS